jgi:glucose-6-phosphate 1-dehydrogenase
VKNVNKPTEERRRGVLRAVGAALFAVVSHVDKLAAGYELVKVAAKSRAPPGRWSARAGLLYAYERVLGDAMHGDATLFAREDYVEEAWRIVDPVLKAGTPIDEYEPGTWGPAAAERVSPADGWENPTIKTT